jgi:hypothetical protein
MKKKGNFSDVTDLIMCTNISFPDYVDGKVKLVKGDQSIILEKQSGVDEIFGSAERYKFSGTDADTRNALAKHLDESNKNKNEAKKLDTSHLTEFIEKFTFIANYQLETLGKEIDAGLKKNLNIEFYRQRLDVRIEKWVKEIKHSQNIFTKDTLQGYLVDNEFQSKMSQFEGEY